MLKMMISTSVWDALHPIAGQNIQQMIVVLKVQSSGAELFVSNPYMASQGAV